MNFFQHQARAQRNTVRLVVFFLLAVVLIFCALGLVGLVAKAAMNTHDPGSRFTWWDPELLGWIGAITLAVIAGGTLIRISELRQGGPAGGQPRGGPRVDRSTTDPGRRRLINVVEEMAIASGVSPPLVFVLEHETGINAFAAGYSPHDAAVAVTRGCLDLLNRDQLQGVIAHEFSHIFNGDMRLNIRLIGVLHGILVIGMLGAGAMRAAAYAGRGRSRDGRGALALLAIGAMVAAVGYVGVFFGRLIKAAVSRQREFLADASAVDFTRNPAGVAGALKRIGGFSGHSRIRSRHAEEMSHMFFSNALSRFYLFGSAMATHPPLPERIRRIEPGWDGRFPAVRAAPAAKAKGAPVSVADAVAGLRMPAAVMFEPAAVVDRVGAPTTGHLAHGAALLASIRDPLRAAARELPGAAAVVWYLVG
ncbi:MAG: M48 family metallopeptidase [Planctomycetota bacterium]